MLFVLDRSKSGSSIRWISPSASEEHLAVGINYLLPELPDDLIQSIRWIGRGSPGCLPGDTRARSILARPGHNPAVHRQKSVPEPGFHDSRNGQTWPSLTPLRSNHAQDKSSIRLRVRPQRCVPAMCWVGDSGSALDGLPVSPNLTTGRGSRHCPSRCGSELGCLYYGLLGGFADGCQPTQGSLIDFHCHGLSSPEAIEERRISSK